jgi:hypothetical protein
VNEKLANIEITEGKYKNLRKYLEKVKCKEQNKAKELGGKIYISEKTIPRDNRGIKRWSFARTVHCELNHKILVLLFILILMLLSTPTLNPYSSAGCPIGANTVCGSSNTFRKQISCSKFLQIFYFNAVCPNVLFSRFRWLRGLRRGSAAARLLGLRVRIPPGAWTSVVSVVCYQVEVSASGWSLVHRSVTESEFDSEAPIMRRPWAH